MQSKILRSGKRLAQLTRKRSPARDRGAPGSREDHLRARTIDIDRFLGQGYLAGGWSRREVLRDVEPEDLLKYGLIPEFVGRLPVVVTLDDLDESTLKKILTEPKNSLVKQYQRLFEMENVDLTLAEETLWAISQKAIEQQDRGARTAVDYGEHPARYHVRSAGPRGGQGGGNLEASRRGHYPTTVHLRRPPRP
jgi:hypothetical protein